MNHHPRSTRRLPRAGLDPIDSPATAQLLIHHLLADPPRFETIALLLDHEHCGHSIICVADTAEPDAVLEVAEVITTAVDHIDPIGAVILVSVRPGSGDDIDDLDRWIELDLRFEEVGIELVEWFVVGCGVSCPRSLIDDISRWRA